MLKALYVIVCEILYATWPLFALVFMAIVINLFVNSILPEAK